ncbi:MAG TPA: BTAD domain-containing putative transcriptional regulator [Nocardioidaceae bacterium]|nr:BTAD domain-containing putative transcriptional regulator [Nocardioidaceae bacterium]
MTPRFRLLGPLQVADPEGGLVDLGGPRPRELLALLLLHPHQLVTRDRLVDTLWGEGATEGAATTLRSHVLAVRRVLTRAGLPDALETRSGGYLLAVDPNEIDAVVFERLVHRGQETSALGRSEESLGLFEQALALWRGEPLVELGPPEFAESTIARLEELWLVAQEGLAGAQLELGRHAQVVGRLQELVAQHPFREELTALLMLALFRSGRQVDALAVYAGARERLADELGLDPGPRLRELETAMLRQDGSLLGAPRPATPTRRPEDAVFAALRRSVMVGRRLELAVLDEAWRDAAAGRLELVTVSGPAGVGKSRLVAELAHHGDCDVLVARCDQRLPAAAVAAAVAELADTAPPALLVVEDAERIDDEASALLAQLLGRPHAGLLVVLCFRDPPGSRHQPLLDLLGHSSIHGITRRVVLRELGADEVAAMVETRTGSVPTGATVAALTERTAGNPFFLHEVLRDFDPARPLSGVPAGARDVLRHRLRSLPESTRAAVSAAAVLGREVELVRLQQLLDASEDEVLASLDAAVAAGFLVESGGSWAGGFAFPHDLMREAVHDELQVHRRQQLHVRVVDVLLAGSPSDADVVAAAGHAVDAGPAADPEQTVALLDQAWRLAATGHGYDEAVRLAEARLALLRRTASPEAAAAAAVEVARLRLQSGRDYERVLELFEDALTTYLALGDTEAAGVVHSRMGGTLAVPRRGMDVTRSLDHFAAAERLLVDPGSAFHLQRGRMSAAMHGLDSDLLGETAERCVALAQRLGRRDLESTAEWGLAWRAVNLGRPTEALTHLESAWSGVQGLGTPLLGWPLANAAALMSTAYLMDPENARAWCRRGLGQPRFDSLAHPHDALVDQLVLALAETGEIDAARRAADRLPEASVGRRLVTFLSGDREQAATAWEAALAEDRVAGDRQDAGLNARWLAEALLSLGQEERAVRVMHEALEMVTAAPQVPLEIWFRARLAQLTSLPRRDAESYVARCEELVAADDWRGLNGEVSLARAVVEARRGEPAAARESYDEAVGTFATYRLPWRLVAADRIEASWGLPPRRVEDRG